MATAVILLAAGQGRRMNSKMPKVLHPLGSAPLLWHAMATAASLAPQRIVVVTGHGADAVAATARSVEEGVRIAHQVERLGTGHAVAQALPELDDFVGDVVVLYGDTPLIRPNTLARMMDARRGGADIVVLGFEAGDPTPYGRLRMAENGSLDAIVEANDATPEEAGITLCNSGVLALSRDRLKDLLARVGNANAKGEFYLTDIVGLARDDGLTSAVIRCTETETLGVNSRADLARAEAAFQERVRADAMAGGATLIDPGSVHFSFDTKLERDVTVGPNVVFGPGVSVADGATIEAFCHLEGATIGPGARVGPFARMRPGSVVQDRARIGNFVETKNVVMGPGAKANHLTYLGDTHVGAKANIGAGTITCNYDGVFKHRTKIGEDAFIGSNTALVAPVCVGANAVVAAGSVITDEVAAGDLAIARSRQQVKPGLGRRLMDRLRALKARGAA